MPYLVSTLDQIASRDPDVEQIAVGDEGPVPSSHHYIAHAADHARKTHLARYRGAHGFTTLDLVLDATSTRAVWAWRFAKLTNDVEMCRQCNATRDGDGGEDQATSWLRRRERNCNTAREWICETRLSVTPSTSPISASVRFSS